MSEKIIETLYALRAANRQWQELDSFVERWDKDPEVETLWTRYREIVSAVRDAWGEPEYEGIGPRWGYVGSGPETGLEDYSHTVRMSWWRKEDFLAAVMVTGHDADSLFVLQLAVRELQDQT